MLWSSKPHICGLLHPSEGLLCVLDKKVHAPKFSMVLLVCHQQSIFLELPFIFITEKTI